MMESLISASKINKSHGDLHVLRNISIDIKRGEIVSITGASGAGKSTLLHILGTLDRADSGKLFIDNTDVLKLVDKKLSAFRNQKIGFVFQMHHLLPEFTALENICIPSFIAGVKKQEAEEKALGLLEILKLRDRVDHKPSQLSGGEQQRVAIARALINNPVMVLADEPSGNLDSKNAYELHQLFLSLREQFHQTFVIVTHNSELARISDRVLDMKDGQIIHS
ncbi:MAG: ABC transporter ATP-binding protein [Bacteroidales bacterium]|jgi:lipoprotein-releasing system ATP-binding protein|nr:ABC transporter ATP-binding protein [Bacteroidales bacterium]